MSFYPFIYELTIDQSLLVPPYNHVHHADIIKILEEARLNLLVARGRPIETFLSQGIFWVIAGLEINYLREIKSGKCRVHTEQAIVNEKSLIIPQSIFNEKEKLAVTAKVQIALFSNESKRALKLGAKEMKIFRDS